ncbi:hypothetical protein N7456_003131 [Penicillium angulare]|uniref:Uncharacterized protein n=1 Tax=Penicillium angulare TaxID=116970 RepID=A0A9W9KHX7_9EURO|nr:hypothetical protein N7456_003131 [Penicillium angulare]
MANMDRERSTQDENPQDEDLHAHNDLVPLQAYAVETPFTSSSCSLKSSKSTGKIQKGKYYD